MSSVYVRSEWECGIEAKPDWDVSLGRDRYIGRVSKPLSSSGVLYSYDGAVSGVIGNLRHVECDSDVSHRDVRDIPGKLVEGVPDFDGVAV